MNARRLRGTRTTALTARIRQGLIIYDGLGKTAQIMPDRARPKYDGAQVALDEAKKADESKEDPGRGWPRRRPA